MAWQYTPYTVVLVLATLVGLVATDLTWQRRDDIAARWASYSNAAITLWAFAHLITVSSTVFEVKLTALLVALLSISLLSIAAFGYAVCFVGRQEWLTRRRVAALWLFPAAVALVFATNQFHELVVVGPELDRSGAFDELTYDVGPLWHVIGLGNYGFPLLGLGLLIRMFRNVRNVYRKITFVVILAFSLLIAISVFSFTRRSPYPHFLLIPHLYLFTGVLAVLAMISVRFVRAIPIDRVLARLGPGSGSVVPLARDYVMEEVDNGILVLDTDQRIVDCNVTGKRMIGADRPMGKHVSDAVRFDRIVDDHELAGAIERDEDPDGLEGEYWIDPVSGEESRCYDVRISPMESGGDRVGTVVLLQDVTEQKRREETLRDREEELTVQKENLQRQKATLERQNERLEAQTRKLEHQNERLDQFASIVSHDLRNPLNVAEGYLGEIRDAAADDGRSVDPELVDEVVHSTDRMGTIIDDALTLARQGKAITETEPVDVEAAVRDAWEQVDTEGASLDVALEDDGLVVEGARSRLVTVFENLFRNALEHGTDETADAERADGPSGADEPSSPDGPAEADDLTVTVGALENGEGFYVADDGRGIPADRRDEVFEHGYTTNSEGTGLGLSIVQDVIKAHGWDVEVGESESGGARFDVVDVELAADDADRVSVDGGTLSTASADSSDGG